MSSPPFRPLVHRTAFATAIVALLPIGVGALVTSMQAGMAFPDWPTSDGHSIFTYPWFADLLRGAMKKFAEHGHRLAGMLIGLTSMLLLAVVWRCERRNWVRGLATAVFVCVVAQGLLGGARVLQNDQRMAMFHGNFAAIVFCLMGTLCLVTSRRWMERNAALPEPGGLRPPLAAGPLRGVTLVTAIAVYGQFILGGRQRHLHDMLYEHLAGAVLVAVLVLATIVLAFRTRDGWIRRAAGWMLFFLLVQAGLGAGAWVTKFGFASIGYVAQHGAPLQLIVRSSHTVVGMLLLLSSVVLALRALRSSSAEHRILRPLVAGSLSTEGGAR